MDKNFLKSFLANSFLYEMIIFVNILCLSLLVYASYMPAELVVETAKYLTNSELLTLMTVPKIEQRFLIPCKKEFIRVFDDPQYTMEENSTKIFVKWSRRLGSLSCLRLLKRDVVVTFENVEQWRNQSWTLQWANVQLIPKNPIGDKGVHVIIDSLLNSRARLTGLTLSSCEITDVGAKALGTFLQTTKTDIERLVLSSNEIGPAGTTEIAKGLSNSKISYLDMDCNAIEDDGLLAIAQVLLAENVVLDELYVGYNEISTPSIVELSKAVCRNLIRKSLSVTGNSIDARGGVALAQAVQCEGSELTMIDLTENDIGEEGGHAFSLAIGNSNLNSLYLRQNDLSRDAICALFTVLKETDNNLIFLDIGLNNVDDESVRYISEALKSDKCKLQTLHIDENRIGDKGAELIADGLRSNLALNTLNLGWNSIGRNGMMHIALALKFSSLTELNLRDNLIGTRASIVLIAALPETSINNLDVSNTKFSTESVMVLARVLPYTKLKILSIGENHFETKGVYEIARALTQSNLTFLNMQNCNLGGGIKWIAEALRTGRTKLQVLNLDTNNINGEDAVYLSKTLHATSLKRLTLNDNLIGNQGLLELFHAMKGNQNLLVFEAMENNIDDDGIENIVELWKNSEIYLNELNLNGNQITDRGANSILEMILRKKTYLQIIRLYNGRITEALNELKEKVKEIVQVMS
jgi:Ran GTPase-activating protein (RanGAP) involved in mRNA processing and transport